MEIYNCKPELIIHQNIVVYPATATVGAAPPPDLGAAKRVLYSLRKSCKFSASSKVTSRLPAGIFLNEF